MDSPADEVAKLDRRSALAQLAAVGACACCATASGCVLVKDTELEESVTRHAPLAPPPELRTLDDRPVRLVDVPLGTPTPYAVGKYPVFLLHYLDTAGREGIVAFDGHCPHARCKYDYDRDARKFICPCHGSQFDSHGVRLQGPARRNLRQLELAVDPTTGFVSVDITKEVAAPVQAAAAQAR